MWEAISPYLSAIVLIGGAVAVVVKWIAPALKLAAEVKDMKKRLDKLEEHDKRDLDSFKGLEKAMLSIVNHMIDGNGIEALKAARNDLQDLLMK